MQARLSPVNSALPPQRQRSILPSIASLTFIEQNPAGGRPGFTPFEHFG
jgi:hypothetical protein